MSDIDAVKQAWIERVLGIDLDDEEPDTEIPDWATARGAWREASEAVDKQISGLQKALRDTGDPELVQIAEFGLNAMTDGYKTSLTAALLELGDAGPTASPAAAQKALSAVEGLRSAISEDPRVAACDSNPSGVQVSIRATLFPALDGLVSALVSA